MFWKRSGRKNGGAGNRHPSLFSPIFSFRRFWSIHLEETFFSSFGPGPGGLVLAHFQLPPVNRFATGSGRVLIIDSGISLIFPGRQSSKNMGKSTVIYKDQSSFDRFIAIPFGRRDKERKKREIMDARSFTSAPEDENVQDFALAKGKEINQRMTQRTGRGAKFL